MKPALLPLLLCALWLETAPALAASPITIVAAENIYGDIAAQIGGDHVAVSSILTNPNQDPHEFEVSPAVARELSGAQIAIENGIGYDPWMDQLLAASRNPDRSVIDAAALGGHKDDENPHVWYDLGTIKAFVRALTQDLIRRDPADAGDYRRRGQEFLNSLQPVENQIAALRARLAGKPVTATEPVFGYMFAALGLDVRNMAFQWAVMNGTEPSASAVAGIENDLRQHRVILLLYNSQASDPVAERMRAIALQSGVPVIGATETEPPGIHYQAWVSGELASIAKALHL